MMEGRFALVNAFVRMYSHTQHTPNPSAHGPWDCPRWMRHSYVFMHIPWRLLSSDRHSSSTGTGKKLSTADKRVSMRKRIRSMKRSFVPAALAVQVTEVTETRREEATAPTRRSYSFPLSSSNLAISRSRPESRDPRDTYPATTPRPARGVGWTRVCRPRASAREAPVLGGTIDA